jgi:hypothetical protein
MGKEELRQLLDRKPEDRSPFIPVIPDRLKRKHGAPHRTFYNLYSISGFVAKDCR